MYEKLPNMMIPMMWFTQRATLTPELANQAKVCGTFPIQFTKTQYPITFSLQMALMLPQLGIYIAIFFGTIGTILVGVFSYICIRKWTTAEVPYEELVR